MTSYSLQPEISLINHQEDEDTVIWKPIKYHLKLGLRGWTVKQTIYMEPDQIESLEDLPLSPLSSLSSLDSTPEPENGENIAQQLAHLINPEVEEREQAFSQGLQILYARLASVELDIFPIRAAPAILSSTFSRARLSHTYGGGAFDTFPKVDTARMLRHNYHRFMCLNALYNPHCPQHPGAPGLFYSLRDPGRWPGQQELVFVRYTANKWNLMGLYAVTRAEPLSTEEFRSLSKAVQNTWFKNIWTHKWGNYTLAAIYLRRLRGREPNDEEVQFYSKRKASLVRRNVLSNEVKQAFFNGDEKINVWTMKCIGYDEGFKRRLVPAGVAKKSSKWQRY